MKFIADILAAIGNGAAVTGTQGCMVWFIDEPEMPKALLEK